MLTQINDNYKDCIIPLGRKLSHISHLHTAPFAGPLWMISANKTLHQVWVILYQDPYTNLTRLPVYMYIPRGITNNIKLYLYTVIINGININKN